MKRLLFFSWLLIVACNNSNTDNNPGKLPVSMVNNPHTANGMDTVAAARKPVMAFTDTMFDFGDIHENEKVEHDFQFTNTGKTPLIITSASGSCGCTVPEYPREPIDPGKTGVMKVTFNSAGKNGPQTKYVTIHTNSIRGTDMLYIKANIPTAGK